MRKFVSILVLWSLLAISANADSLAIYLKSKSAGDVISVTDWNSLVSGLVGGVSDVNLAHQVCDFAVSSTDAGDFETGTVIPLFRPPAGAAVTIESIECGVIGSGTIAFGLEERAITDMNTSQDTVLGFVRNATIDSVVKIIDGDSLDDGTLATNRVLCATFTTNCVTGTVQRMFGRVYYNKILTQ